MSMMKDSKIDDAWLREVMTKNPPSLIKANGVPNGNIFTGPVRLSFVHLIEPSEKKLDDGTKVPGDYNVALLFPVGTDMSLFEKVWAEKAHEAFPNNWTPEGKSVGLHSPFHPQDEKAFGAKPYPGYTPGGVYMNVSTKYKPAIYDLNKQVLVNPETKVYSGAWAFLALNVYHYRNKKTGVGFGIQSVMILADDAKLTGGGGNPNADFGAVQITATSNVAAKFGEVPGAAAPPATSVMPQGGHVGQRGSLPTAGLPPVETDEERLLREMTE